jgi:hypothetical protein
VVEDVEELGAELGVEAFGELRGLQEGSVEVDEVGAGEGVAAKIADGSCCGGEEGGGVEELGGCAGIEIAVEVGVDVGADGVACVAGAGGVVAELWGEGEAGLKRGDGAYGPSGDEAVGEGVGGR